MTRGFKSNPTSCEWLLFLAMKYSALACAVACLLGSFGEVHDSMVKDFQEDCAGCGALTAAVRVFRIRATRRDVSRTVFGCNRQYRVMSLQPS